MGDLFKELIKMHSNNNNRN